MIQAEKILTKAFDGPIGSRAIRKGERMRRTEAFDQQADSLILEMGGTVGHELQGKG